MTLIKKLLEIIVNLVYIKMEMIPSENTHTY